MDRTTDGRVGLLSRISRAEWLVAALVVLVLVVLIVIEPDVLEAPIQSVRTVVFTVGGTLLAAVALVVMLRRDVHPAVRIAVLVVPLAVVSYWLVSPYFVDDVVEDDFATSISAASDSTSTTTTPSTAPTPSAPAAGTPPPTTIAPPPPEPVLIGSGQFQGLAGHEGTGDAGIFRLPDGGLVARLENLQLENGPDLQLYVAPGPDVRSLIEGSIHLGGLRGNVGNQTYDLPSGTTLAPGEWTVLVWCRAFEVEFVNATLKHRVSDHCIASATTESIPAAGRPPGTDRPGRGGRRRTHPTRGSRRRGHRPCRRRSSGRTRGVSTTASGTAS